MKRLGDGLFSILLAVLFLLGFAPGLGPRLTAGILMCLGLVLLYGRSFKPSHREPSEEPVTERGPAFLESTSDHELPISMEKLTKAYRHRQRREVDDQLSQSLLDMLELMRAAVPCHTAAIFLIGRADTVYLKVWSSDKEEAVIPGAVISHGQGLLGVMAKENNERLVENDFVARSPTLFYYKEHVGIRSLVAVPIRVDQIFRGIVVVDSLEKGRFKKQDMDRLTIFSRTAGQLAFQSYLQLEHRIDRERISALKEMDRSFLEVMRVDEIIHQLAHIVEQAVDHDRLMIVLHTTGDRAKVVLASGEDAAEFQDFEFDIHEPGVASLSLVKGIPIHRQFERGRYVPRFNSREKANVEIRTMVCEPLGSKEECLGSVIIESRSTRPYGEMDVEVLRNLTAAASVALEKAHNLETMQQLATRDGLTGLANHREFQNILRQEIRAANRYGYSLALIMADIDYFKKINDTYGHPAGDVVLGQIAQILQNNIRQGVDYVARYGGEEFAVVLGKADEAMMLETAERIRTRVERTKIEIGTGKAISVTMSFGCALFPENAKSQKDFVDRTDKALYAAKRGGRNRVEKVI